MEKRIYTISQVARFVSLPEKKIQKLAENGILEGQKIQGAWCFSKADLLVWFEKTLGHTEEIEKHLDRMTDFAALHIPQEEPEQVSLSQLIEPDQILFPFGAKTKESVIRTLSERAEELNLVWNAETLADAIRAREEMMSTAMENGVAILHSRRPMPENTAQTFVLVGVSLRGIPFGGGYNNLTDIFFLLCAMDDKIHLQLLAEIGRLLKKPDFLTELRERDSIQNIADWFHESLK